VGRTIRLVRPLVPDEAGCTEPGASSSLGSTAQPDLLRKRATAVAIIGVIAISFSSPTQRRGYRGVATVRCAFLAIGYKGFFLLSLEAGSKGSWPF
jgi:hypothetical protein